MLASQQSDLEVADSLGYEALALFRELGDRRGVGWTLHVLGWNAMARGAYGEARRLYEEAADAHSGPGDEQLQRRALMALASVETSKETTTGPSACFTTSSRARGAKGQPSTWRWHSATSASRRTSPERRSRGDGRWRRASRCAGRTPASRDCNRAVQPRLHAATPRPDEALTHFSESLTLSREIEEPRTIAYCLEGGAGILAARGNPTDATTLLAAASAIRALTGAVASPGRRASADTLVAQCREALTAEAFDRAWEKGVALDANAAADWALRLLDEGE